MVNQTLGDIEERMRKTVEGFRHDLSTLRTGRASPSLVEHIKVDYAGTPLPLNQLANINIPEARLIYIQPWDKSSIQSIIKAIQASELGLNPTTDGNIIRIPIPPLSEERRAELIKIVRRRLEDRRVAVRNIRREALDELKTLEKNKEISQDEQKRSTERLQKLTDGYIAELEKVARDKETELAQV